MAACENKPLDEKFGEGIIRQDTWLEAGDELFQKFLRGTGRLSALVKGGLKKLMNSGFTLETMSYIFQSSNSRYQQRLSWLLRKPP